MNFAISCTVPEAHLGTVMACIARAGGEDVYVSPIIEVERAPATQLRTLKPGEKRKRRASEATPTLNEVLYTFIASQGGCEFKLVKE